MGLYLSNDGEIAVFFLCLSKLYRSYSSKLAVIKGIKLVTYKA